MAARRWITYATCAWSLAFGAPHLWWALGVSYGFPGGEESYRFFMSSAWRVVYDWVVIVCSMLGVVVPLALLKPAETVARRWIPLWCAWIAFFLLTVRGAGGLVVDSGYGLAWDAAFLTGGLLFLGVAHFGRVAGRAPDAHTQAKATSPGATP